MPPMFGPQMYAGADMAPIPLIAYPAGRGAWGVTSDEDAWRLEWSLHHPIGLMLHDERMLRAAATGDDD